MSFNHIADLSYYQLASETDNQFVAKQKTTSTEIIMCEKAICGSQFTITFIDISRITAENGQSI